VNIIVYLRKETKSNLTIEKYALKDLSSSHHIRFLVDYQQLIYKYYDRNKLTTLNGEEQFYDYLYLEYIIKFEEHLDDIPPKYSVPLSELVEYSKKKTSSINNGDIIKCIQKNYEQIFSLAKYLSDMGLMKETLRLAINFNSGIKEYNIFEYLISKHTFFAFDNFDNLYSILKRNNQELLQMLIFDNFDKLSNKRFKDVCNIAKKLYQHKFKAIARKVGIKIFKCVVKRHKEKYDEFFLQSDLKVAYNTLYYLKMNESKELISIIRENNEKVNKSIIERGHKFEYEFSIEPYMKWMEDNKHVLSLSRYLTISHIKDDNKLWESQVVKESVSFKSSLTDILLRSSNTNDYFTLSRKNHIDITSRIHSSKLLYWFSKNELTDEFNKSLKVVVESIFEILDNDIEFENLSENIDGLTKLLNVAIKNKEHGVLLHTKLMYVISFLEKVLRLVYVSMDNEVFFEKNITLGAIFRNENDFNQFILKLLGEHHLRWTRYFLLKDDKEVGLEYRNKIAHLRDINPHDMEMFEFLKVNWIIISTINTILVNLVNDEKLDIILRKSID